MSQVKVDNKKTVVISSDSEDYKNITVIKDDLHEKNTHNVVYKNKDGTYCKCTIRLDTEKPLRVIGGLESRAWDGSKYVDDTFTGNFSMGVCLYADANKPTEDELKTKQFFDNLTEHIVNEYSKSLGNNVDVKKKKNFYMIDTDDDSLKFKHLVKNGNETNDKKYSDTFKMSYPVKYSISAEERNKMDRDKRKQYREVWKLFKNKMGDTVDSKELHPQKLKESKKNLFIRTHFVPDRITLGDGKWGIKLSGRDTYCYFRKYTGGGNQSKISDFKNAKDFDEDEVDDETLSGDEY